tara:strand:+ start:829 stop:1146 length:318 start_codon:yes stop_codon:yes gene_type:complete
MRERSDCEKVIVRMLEGILGHMVPNMKVKVVIGMCGNKPFTLRQTKQMTLHDYADIDISRNDEELYQHLDITLNKTVVGDPDIGSIVCDLFDTIEAKTDQFRLMR